MEDVLSLVGTFLTNKDVFIMSIVNKEWKKSQIYNKEEIFKKIKAEVFVKHMCANCCPCMLEKFCESVIPDFKLKRHMCSVLNKKKVPMWFNQYLK